VRSARYLVRAVVFEHRSVREVARAHGVSKTWLYELVARYRDGGDAALEPRSRRPTRSPTRISGAFEDEIVELRKLLSEEGFDAGAVTIQSHLLRRHDAAPAVSSIWRVLNRRGFVTPQPQKRPKSSYVRFEADLPNERWQMDMTHVELADGRIVEVLNVIDDHSRLCVASRAFSVVTAPDVVAVFADATSAYGLPASVLSDNGAIFTAAYRKGRCLTEVVLAAQGINFRHSRPYHPQTCGKVERFHQTEKKYLAARRALARCQSSNAGSTRSPPTTTKYARTGPKVGAHRPRPMRRASRRHRRGSPPCRFSITGSAATGSTTTARSPCDTPAGFATFRSAIPTRANEYWPSWQTGTCGCSPRPENSWATTSSTRPRTTRPSSNNNVRNVWRQVSTMSRDIA